MANKITISPPNHTVGVPPLPLSIQIDLESGENFDTSDDIVTTIEFERNSNKRSKTIIASEPTRVRHSFIECMLSFSGDPKGKYDVTVTQKEKNNRKAKASGWTGDDVFVVK